MQTPLPVILARLAWYGYSGKGALTAIAWAAGNDNGVGVEELAASDCTAGAVRFFARVFFCTGIAGVTGFFWRVRRLPGRRRWLSSRCPGCNFQARFGLFRFRRRHRLAGLELVRKICRGRFLRAR